MADAPSQPAGHPTERLIGTAPALAALRGQIRHLVLAQAYLQQYTAAHGVPPKRLSTGAEAWLQAYVWPGNVRELRHVMERVTLLHIGEKVDAETLTQLCLPQTAPAPGGEAVVESQQPEPVSPEPAEAAQIRQALVQTGGNVAWAARLLGVSRDTVRYRMQRYGITRLRPTASPTPEAAEPAPPDALQTPRGEPLEAAVSPAGVMTRSCPQCQQTNPADAPVCAACSILLAVLCARCGQDTLPGAESCLACATRLSSSPAPGTVPPSGTPGALTHRDVRLPPVTLPPREAERRYLSVLCCDLVDATGLVNHLDPEALREVIRGYHHTCAEVIQRFDGYVDQYAGDAVVACFGYPVAHEDDAQRAVRAGLGILDALDALNRRLALPAGDRVAVRTPRRSAPSSFLGPTRNGAMKPMLSGFLARSRRIAIRRRASRLKPITDRPSPWPTSSACARSWPTVTSGSAPCIPCKADQSRRVPSCPPPSSCIAPWT